MFSSGSNGNGRAREMCVKNTIRAFFLINEAAVFFSIGFTKKFGLLEHLRTTLRVIRVLHETVVARVRTTPRTVRSEATTALFVRSRAR